MKTKVDIKDFKDFVKGKSFKDNTNIYLFKNEGQETLQINELVGEFEKGQVSDYLRYEILGKDNNVIQNGIMYRKSEEYKNLPQYPYIENIGGSMLKFCTGCGSVVLTNQITTAKADKCIYCEMYVCKTCKKRVPKAEYENGQCTKCRGKKGG